MKSQQEIHYKLYVRDTTTVTSLRKVFHVGSLIIASLAGLITAYIFGHSMTVFGNNCILDAEIVFTDANVTEESAYGLPITPLNITPLNLFGTNWGRPTKCEFCQFTPLAAMIFAVIWGTFFIICSKGGTGYVTDLVYYPWRMVYPAICFSFVATICLLTSSLIMKKGVHAFCQEFEVVFNTTGCTDAIDEYTIYFSEDETRSDFITMLKLSIFFSFTCFAGWLLQLVTLILRVVFVGDFQLVGITVVPDEEDKSV